MGARAALARSADFELELRRLERLRLRLEVLEHEAARVRDELNACAVRVVTLAQAPLGRPPARRAAVLEALAKGPARLTELAGLVGASPQPLSWLLNRLCAEGLVERRGRGVYGLVAKG